MKLHNRLAIALLTCSLLSGSVTAVAAQSEYQTADITTSLKAATVMSQENILKIAQYHIEHYIQDDIQTKGRQIILSDDLLDLYDFEDNLFAYMVPLMEGSKEIGFITVGAISDGYDVYSIRIEDNAVQSLRQQLAAGGSESGVVFLPPYKYYVKSTLNNEQKYVDVTLPSAVKDVTALINKNKKEIQTNYKSIRSVENQNHLQKLIKAVDSSQTEANDIKAVTKEDVSLYSEKNFSQFVPIEYPKGSGVYSYGGDQDWYAKSSEKQNGCGPVAAANITNYMAKVTNSTKYGKMYTGSTLSHADFLSHMNTMYNRINPGFLGELSIWGFADDVEAYAKDKGVTLKRVTSNASFTLDNSANYIKAGLNSNVPVGTLNLSKFSDYQFEWHWMTITKYYRDVNDNRWIAVSTWGRRESINYRTHFDAMKAFEGIIGSPGIIYFS